MQVVFTTLWCWHICSAEFTNANAYWIGSWRNIDLGTYCPIKVKSKLIFFPGGVLHGPGCVQQGRCPQHHRQLWSTQLPSIEGVLPAVWDGSAEPERFQTGSSEAPGPGTRGHCYFPLHLFIQAGVWTNAHELVHFVHMLTCRFYALNSCVLVTVTELACF